MDVPSRIAEQLADGDLDVALIPSVRPARVALGLKSSLRLLGDRCLANRRQKNAENCIRVPGVLEFR